MEYLKHCTARAQGTKTGCEGQNKPAFNPRMHATNERTAGMAYNNISHLPAMRYDELFHLPLAHEMSRHISH